MPIQPADIRKGAAEALIQASTRFRPDQIHAYERAMELETEQNARWILQMILENAIIADKQKLPLCDDTGIPHVLLEVGESADVAGGVCAVLEAVHAGIADGLRALPGRPMAVKGDDWERIAQTRGLYEDAAMVLPAPIRVKGIEGNQIRLHVLMLGGGPEIRSRTYRVFHHHQADTVSQTVAEWAVEMAGLLGCTPCVPAVGIGRTHYEAACLMLDAMAYKNFGNENAFERSITEAVNATRCGPLGIGGSITALNTFVQVGPQRASGVRIASLRLGCCFDPRRSTVVLE
jgi:fumarate hydratase subunit alpha